MPDKEKIQKITDLLNNIVKNNNLTLDVFCNEEVINIALQASETNRFDQENITKEINSRLNEEFPQSKEIRIVFSTKKIEKLKHAIPNIKKIILMASAKGGVGKSTTAVNIAKGLAKEDFSVGIVDADIYGPTIPKILGISKRPETEDGKMLPIYQDNIYSISIGNIVDESQAAIWRGPMISKALYQLLVGVKWPKLDYLIVDMPPGTGDIYLSLAENFIIDGVVLITTPQNIAISILQKSVSFFKKTNIPLIGVIENMSYFLDEENNIKHYLFGPSLTEEKMDCKFLGQIPLNNKISNFSDKGISLVNENCFKIYHNIAKNILKII